MPLTKSLERMGITAQDYDAPVLCPGGERIQETGQGPACRCKIAEDTVTAALDPSSLQSFCMGKYIDCPIWTDSKERTWEARCKLVDDHEQPERTLDLDAVPVTHDSEVPVGGFHEVP